MADNVTLSAGTADGAVIATDDIGGVHYQINKLAFGALNTATLVHSSEGLPVNVVAGTVAVTHTALTELAAAIDTEVQVDIVSSALPSGAATEAKQDTAITALQLIDDVVYVDDADWTDSTSKHALVGGLYQSTPQTVTDGDVAPFNITANGALHVAQQGTVVVDLGANNDVTVTGTVDLGATDNAVLDNIDADLTTIIGHVDGIEGLLTTIDADTGNLAGMATSLSNIDTDATTIIGHLDGVEALLGTIDADTGNIATSVAVMDDWDESDRAKVNSQEVSGVMIENAVAVTVKYAVIDAATSGDNTIVAAVAGKKIRVLSLFLVSSGTVNVRFENGAGGTALTGQMNLVANTGFVLPHNPHGWFQCGTDNTLLNLELSGAVSVDGALTYIEAE